MTTSVSLSMGQSILLSGLAAIALVYVAYFRIWTALAVASDFLFAVALAVCVTSVIAPGVFDVVSRAIIDRSPLPAALDEADAQVEALAALPGELIDRALARIGFGDDADDGSAAEAVVEPPLTPFETAMAAAGPTSSTSAIPAMPPVPPSPGITPSAPARSDSIDAIAAIGDDPLSAEAPPVEGFFTRSIRPSVEGLVALVLRGSTLVVSGLLLILSLASRASTTTAKRLRTLAERIDALEARHDAGPLASVGAA